VNRGALRDIIDQMEKTTWMKTAFAETYEPRLNLKALSRLTADMMPHQNQFLAW